MRIRNIKLITLVICLLVLVSSLGCSNEETESLNLPSAQETQQPTAPSEQDQAPDAQTVYTPPERSAREDHLLSLPELELPRVDVAQLNAVQPVLSEPQVNAAPVVFIMDGGQGDGSSPDSPLSLEVSNNVCVSEGSETSIVGYYDSLLYQAAAKLYGTGGTIVLVGPVLCDGDDGIGEKDTQELRLPHLGGAAITITSVWDGVDYRETNGARLILQAPVNLSLNNPTTFRDLDICTQAGGGFAGINRLITCDGFQTVVDVGVRCIPLDENGAVLTEPSVDTYPSIVGGHRLNSLEGGTDLTIRSGSFYTVAGGNLGIGIGGYGDLKGSTQLTIEGTARILGVLTATSPDSRALQDGNAILTIRGGEICNKVQISGSGGFAGPNCKAVVRIKGGTFSDMVKIMAKSGSSYYGSKAGATLLDFSGYAEDDIDILSKAVGFDQLAGRDTDVSQIILDALPERETYFTGDLLDLTGLSLVMTYGDKEKALDYDSSISGFRFYTQDGVEIDPETTYLTADMTTIQVCYGQIVIGTYPITVLSRPAISIVATAVDAAAERQELGFLFGVEAGDWPDLEIQSCGVLALPAELLEQTTDLLQGTMAGYQDLAAGQVPSHVISAWAGETNSLLYASVKDIPVEEYGLQYTAVAYYTFVYDGDVYVAYSQPCTTSVYAAAKENDLMPSVVALADSGAGSTFSEALVSEKVEAMIAYFESMALQRWIAPEEINFAGSSVVTGGLQYHAGKEYIGLPYIGGYNGIDNLENFSNYLDENGVYTGPTAWNTMHGNNCTSAIFQSISRVTNNYGYWAEVGDPLLNIIPKMDNDASPVVKVGPYTIKHTSAQSPVIIQDHADYQIIYESYASAQRGDYLFSHWLSGGNQLLSHLRLITEVSVIRNEDGTIDPYTSYLLVHEQTSTMDQNAATSWGLDRKFFFAQLVSEGYLPTRDAAFESGYFETPHCVVYDVNSPENIAGGVQGQVVSNYDLSEVELEITDATTGEIVFSSKSYCYFNRTCSLTTLDPKNQVQDLVGTGLYQYILRVTTANEEQELVRFVF